MKSHHTVNSHQEMVEQWDGSYRHPAFVEQLFSEDYSSYVYSSSSHLHPKTEFVYTDTP